jgi:hypothetical protein
MAQLVAMVQAVWYATPGSRCRNFAETPRLSRPIRCAKPLGQIGSSFGEHRSIGHRFLPVAGRTFIHPWTRLLPLCLASTAPGTSKSAGPAEPSQMFDTLFLGIKLEYKLSQPSH